MISLAELKNDISAKQFSWLVTGAAGFIGSHLCEDLLLANQIVICFDNFSTGKKENIELLKKKLNKEQINNFKFIEGDICNINDCENACKDADIILHQAALGSVPRSIKEPLNSIKSNILGFANILWSANLAQVKRIVYASSSSVYGSLDSLPKVENLVGKVLSPYAATKMCDEIIADAFAVSYNLELVGLRYFNIFGARQDPEGAYAAVIPRWINELKHKKTPCIYGDGTTSRDFCYVKNAVKANLLAATTKNTEALNKVYNISVGGRTSLNELYSTIVFQLKKHVIHTLPESANYADFRKGDVKHSQADITLAKKLLNYSPEYTIEEGLKDCISSYL
jgi:UDP-N-acetylglucosamine 4-epimerase